MSTPNSSRLVWISAAIAWIAAVCLYPSWWDPSGTRLNPIENGKEAFILTLRDHDPLGRILRKGSTVTIAREDPPPAPAPLAPGTLPPAIVQPTGMPLPSRHEKIPNVRVVGRSCESDSANTGCYVVVAVFPSDIPKLMSAGPLWVWLEEQ